MIFALKPFMKTPFCISGHGMPGATVADEFDKTLAFLEAIYLDEAAEHGGSLDIENYCTVSLFFEQAYLSR